MGAARWRRWASRLAPWLITAAVIALLLRRYGLEEIAAEIERGRASVLVPWALGAGLLSLLIMGTADWLVLRALAGALRWRDVVRGKGGTGVLASVSYGVGHGGYGLWIARRTGCGARAAVGTVAYLMLSDLTAVCAIASVTIWLADLRLPEAAELALQIIAPAGAAVLVGAALFGPRILPRLVRDPRLVLPWTRVGARTYALSLVLRIGSALAGMIITWAAAAGFGLELPLRAVLTYLPIVFLIGSLPINVAGLGPVQLVWVFFFGAHAPGEQILAFQLLFSTLVHASIVVRGLPFVAGAVADIEAGARNDAA